MTSRRALTIIAGLIVLGVGGLLLWRAMAPAILRQAMLPAGSFATDSRDPRPDYKQLLAWAAHPKLVGNAAMQSPNGYLAAPFPAIDVFYVLPTTYAGREHWNGPLNDPAVLNLQNVMLRAQTSAFNGVGQVWAPRYRQASLGAMFASDENSKAALTLASGDVLAAFDAFQKLRDAKRPFMLVGHSQGAMHVLGLLKDRVAGHPAQQSMVAAYVIGWPVSIEADLAPLGLAVCQTPAATGCVISWQSYGKGANLKAAAKAMEQVATLSGQPRAGTHQACVSPLGFWASIETADRNRNLGALPFADRTKPVVELVPHLVGARCDTSGFLVLDPSPGTPFDERKLPNGNYHVYDINLFWANIRANAEARVESFLTPQ
jgi:Protein of unknown function (DUF3089)